MLLGFPDYIEIRCSGNIPCLQFTIIQRKVKSLNASGKTLGGILSNTGHTENTTKPDFRSISILDLCVGTCCQANKLCMKSFSPLMLTI